MTQEQGPKRYSRRDLLTKGVPAVGAAAFLAACGEKFSPSEAEKQQLSDVRDLIKTAIDYDISRGLLKNSDEYLLSTKVEEINGIGFTFRKSIYKYDANYAGDTDYDTFYVNAKIYYDEESGRISERIVEVPDVKILLTYGLDYYSRYSGYLPYKDFTSPEKLLDAAFKVFNLPPAVSTNLSIDEKPGLITVESNWEDPSGENASFIINSQGVFEYRLAR
jgi:hypothetical protein